MPVHEPAWLSWWQLGLELELELGLLSLDRTRCHPCWLLAWIRLLASQLVLPVLDPWRPPADAGAGSHALALCERGDVAERPVAQAHAPLLRGLLSAWWL